MRCLTWILLICIVVTCVCFHVLIRCLFIPKESDILHVPLSTLVWSDGFKHAAIKVNATTYPSPNGIKNTQPIYDPTKSTCIVNRTVKTFPQDYSPSELSTIFKNHTKLFVQNVDLTKLSLSQKQKVFPLPLGCDFHTIHNGPRWGSKQTPWYKQNKLLLTLRQQALPLTSRKQKILITWTSESNTSARHVKSGYRSRPSLWKGCMSNDLCDLFLGNRADVWREMGKYQFVYSPIGNGFDCHRTWEALIMGCVVIAQRNPVLENFKSQFPIIFNDQPENITIGDLQKWSNAQSSASLHLLQLSHWMKNPNEGCESRFLTVMGTIRDNAKYLPKIFSKLKELEAKLETNIRYVFYENDSRDQSVKITQTFLKDRCGYLITQSGIHRKFPARTTRLAYARHQLHLASMEHPTEFVIMLDMDDVNVNLNVSSVIKTLQNTMAWDVATANQKRHYYDKWALRTNKKKNNCWKNEKCSNFFLRAWLPNNLSHGNIIPIHQPPIPVRSAFGGFAIYKWKYWKDGLFENPKGDCEHVLFFDNMRSHWPNVRVVIMPNLINN